MTDSERLDIDDVERFWKGQLEQWKARDRDKAYLFISPGEARDVLRVIARVRALEAQAALDAKVREAAHILVNKGIDMVVGRVVENRERNAALKDIAVLRAALAARDKEA